MKQAAKRTRFDAARCKHVANESVIEHAPLCNEDSPVGANSLVN